MVRLCLLFFILVPLFMSTPIIESRPAAFSRDKDFFSTKDLIVNKESDTVLKRTRRQVDIQRMCKEKYKAISQSDIPEDQKRTQLKKLSDYCYQQYIEEKH